VVLQRKSFELLCLLVRSGGNLLTRGELMDQLWGDTFVSDNNLSQQVRALRKALGDNGNGTRLIETVPGQGFRFVSEVRCARLPSESEYSSRVPYPSHDKNGGQP